MIDYEAVPSGLELSRRIADCLEASAPRGYAPDERPRAIRSLNDILQGRSTRPVDELLVELDKCEDTRLPAILEDVRAFLRQKALLTKPYHKRPSRKAFAFQWAKGSDGRKLKVIDQKLYDRAAREGFPANFFREASFDHVTFALCVLDIHGDREFKTCYGDICKIVDALRDYSRLLKMVCKTWNLQGFHRAKYEFYADKLREIADKFQDGIGYDYDAALERCRKKQGKKPRDEDVGGEALAMGLLKAQQAAEAKTRKAVEKGAGGKAVQAEDSAGSDPWEEDF